MVTDVLIFIAGMLLGGLLERWHKKKCLEEAWAAKERRQRANDVLLRR